VVRALDSQLGGCRFESRLSTFIKRRQANYSHTCASVTKQCNLVLANGQWCSLTGNVTAGPADTFMTSHLRADCLETRIRSRPTLLASMVLHLLLCITRIYHVSWVEQLVPSLVTLCCYTRHIHMLTNHQLSAQYSAHIDAAIQALFSKMQYTSHCLHPLLHPERSMSTLLRSRSHNFTLPSRVFNLHKCSFVVNCLFQVIGLVCFISSFVFCYT